ncbi:MAG: DMT family transporter [Nocardiopsis sp. BM-2018]|nr:MAG: DMT family transporter [Nocardiopsis sp. BM-2018]
MTFAVGVLTLVAITIVWGTTFVVVKGSLETIPVPLLLALRFSLAAACFAFVRFDRRALVPALWLGLLAFAGFATQTLGLSITSASRSAFITGFAVVLTPLVAAIWFRHRVAPRVFVASAVALAGLSLLTLRGGDGQGINAGDLWTVLTALAYALYIVYLGQVAGRADVAALAGLQHLPMAALAWLWSVPHLGALAHVPLTTYLAIAYLALVATALVAWLQVGAQRVVPAPLAAIIFVLEPVFAALFAWWLVGEVLGPGGWAGGALVIVAMLVAEVRLRRAPWRATMERR